MNLSASKELDLLTKWLGKASSNYVKRLRSVHIENPKCSPADGLGAAGGSLLLSRGH